MNQTCKDERVRLLTCEQLLDLFHSKTQAAVANATSTSGSEQVRCRVYCRLFAGLFCQQNVSVFGGFLKTRQQTSGSNRVRLQRFWWSACF